MLKCWGNKCFICSLFHIWPDSRQYNDRRSRTGSILWKTAIWGQSRDRLRAFFGVCADGYIVAWTKGGGEKIFSRSSGHSIHAIMCCLWFEQICRQWYGTNKHDQIAKDHKEKGRGSHSLAVLPLSGILSCHHGVGNFTGLLLVLFQYFSNSLVVYHYWQRLVERSIFTGPPYRGLYLPAGDELLPRTEMSSPLPQSHRVQKITSVLRQAGVNIHKTGTAS